jgi:eukaryotic-like serine/threonine-protein kinase
VKGPNTTFRPIRIGRYVLFDEIGSGGMATVHLARLEGASDFARTVAIKRVHPRHGTDAQVRASILDEARLASRIHHPNVAAVLDVVETETEVVLVMEYIHGLPLYSLMRISRSGAQPVPFAISSAIMSEVLKGLHAAHLAKDAEGVPLKIVHRDVSPQNVLVGADGTTRVIDFGIALATKRAQSTAEGTFKGKLSYMAPEQLSSLPATTHSDVYAAGVVLWELVVGRKLFDAEEPAVVFMKIVNAEIPAPRSLNPDIPPALEAVVLRALSLKPHNRFRTALEMSEALEQAQAAASATYVAEWVRELGGTALDERSQVLSRFERTDTRRLDVISSEASALASSEYAMLASGSGSGTSAVISPPAAPAPPPPQSRKPDFQAKSFVTQKATEPKRGLIVLMFGITLAVGLAVFAYMLPTIVRDGYIKMARNRGVELAIDHVSVSLQSVVLWNVHVSASDVPSVQAAADSVRVDFTFITPALVSLHGLRVDGTGTLSTMQTELERFRTKLAPDGRGAVNAPLKVFVESGEVHFASTFGAGTLATLDGLTGTALLEPEALDTFDLSGSFRVRKDKDSDGKPLREPIVWGPWNASHHQVGAMTQLSVALDPRGTLSSTVTVRCTKDGECFFTANVRGGLAELGIPAKAFQVPLPQYVEASASLSMASRSSANIVKGDIVIGVRSAAVEARLAISAEASKDAAAFLVRQDGQSAPKPTRLVGTLMVGSKRVPAEGSIGWLPLHITVFVRSARVASTGAVSANASEWLLNVDSEGFDLSSFGPASSIEL